MWPRLAAFAAIAVLAAAPLAEAKPAPVIYFLQDGPEGPTGTGYLDAYDPAKRNVPNGTSPQSRVVLAGMDAVLPVRFQAPEGAQHPTRLFGPLIAGVWLGESTVLQGNLTVVLLEVPAHEPAVAPPVPGLPTLPDPTAPAPRVLGEATIALDQDLGTMPNVTNLVPPVPEDPTADPQGTVTGIVLYEAAQLLPLILQPPAILNFGVIDVEVNATSTLALGFRLDQGSSPAAGPLGAFGQLNYNYALGPSYVYVPWYNPDPPKPTSTATKAPTTSVAPTRIPTSTGGPTTSNVEYVDEGKGAPGVPALALLGALAALAFAARRRLA